MSRSSSNSTTPNPSDKELPPTNPTAAAHAGTIAGDRQGEHPDKKTFVQTPGVGTNVESVLTAGKHVIHVTTKGAAVLEAMEAKAAAAQGKGTGGKHDKHSLISKVKHAAATTGEYVTQSKEEYIKIKAAEDVATQEGVYKTQGDRRKKKEEKQQADMVEILPAKEDVRQLESMVEHAGSIQGISLRKGGAVARLQSAADRGASCKVPKKVADLLIDATINRPLDIKTRAEARVTRMEHGVAGGEQSQVTSGGRKPMPELVRGTDHLLTVNVPTSQGTKGAGQAAGPEVEEEESN